MSKSVDPDRVAELIFAAFVVAGLSFIMSLATLSVVILVVL